MRVLITGGTGYVGGRLARHLHLGAPGQYAVRLGSRQAVPLGAAGLGARGVQIDWTSAQSLRTACEGQDAVVHLAARNAPDCAKNPAAALIDNAVATAHLLDAAIARGVKRFIYLSTAHVYGAPLSGVITEDTSLRALHPYATSHRAAEDVVRFAHQQGAIEGIVVRLSNAFGAPASVQANCWMLLVNDLCRQAVQSGQLVLHSDGMARRDFVPLDDVCAALECLLHARNFDPAQNVFNLGGEWAPTVFEMTQRIAARCVKVLGRSPAIHRPQALDVPVPEPAPMLDFRTDRLKALGFRARHAIDEEIDATLQLCMEQKGTAG